MTDQKTKKHAPGKGRPLSAGKGRTLSETMRERAEARAAEDAAVRDELAAADDAAVARAGLAAGARPEDLPPDELRRLLAAQVEGDGAVETDEAADDDEERDVEDDGDEDEDEAGGGGDESLAAEGREGVDDDGEEVAASGLGNQRYVIAGFCGVWLASAYVLARFLESVWSWAAAKTSFVAFAPRLAAVPHEGELVSRASVSLVVGGIAGGVVVLRYYIREDVRKWADEVADETSKVKWPTRKEIGNYTVIVLTASALLTLFLTLVDRFLAFATNLIYSSGA